MQATQLRSQALPSILTASVSPAVVASASEQPTRVLVRNTSSTAALLSVNVADVAPLSGAMYRLPGGAADVLVLAPNQQLFGAGEAAGCQLSIAVSEAFPGGNGRA